MIYVGRHTSGSSMSVECWSAIDGGPCPGDIAFGDAIAAISSRDALRVRYTKRKHVIASNVNIGCEAVSMVVSRMKENWCFLWLAFMIETQ